MLLAGQICARLCLCAALQHRPKIQFRQLTFTFFPLNWRHPIMYRSGSVPRWPDSFVPIRAGPEFDPLYLGLIPFFLLLRSGARWALAQDCLSLTRAPCGPLFPTPTRSGPLALQVAPVLPEPAQSSSSIFSFSEIPANMQNLLNPYLSNGNSK
jgi:hypothetical protein